jgi:acyl dehydratase
MKRVLSFDELPALVGHEIGVSDWIVVDQARIDAFAHATDDLQWIHVDSARAAAGPFGTTVAHGFLTLSLLAPMSYATLEVSGVSRGINYGLNRVRFIAPVPAGSRLRGRFRLLECQPIDGGVQIVREATIEREGQERPVCVAESITRLYR